MSRVSVHKPGFSSNPGGPASSSSHSRTCRVAAWAQGKGLPVRVFVPRERRPRIAASRCRAAVVPQPAGTCRTTLPSGPPDGRNGGRSCASTISPCRFAYFATCRVAFANRSLRNFSSEVSGFSRGSQPYDLLIHHHGDEFDKRRFCAPADFCSDLRAVRDRITVDCSEEAAVGHHVIGPVTANVTECNLAERTNGIGLAGSNHVVVGNVALQHFMHGCNVVPGKAEVAANINVSER